MIINGKDYDRLISLAKTRIHENVDGIINHKSMVPEGDNFLIVSNGHADNTEIYCNGKSVNNVMSIEFDKLVPGGVVVAKIEILAPRLHMRVNAK